MIKSHQRDRLRVLEINDARQGTWTFTVNDIVLDGYQFGRGNGVLSASIRVK